MVRTGGYSVYIRKEEERILQKEAMRRGVTILDLLKESLERKIEKIRGGAVRRRRRW